MTDRNQPGGTPGRWGENPAGEPAPQQPMAPQSQSWQTPPQPAAHQGQGVGNQYGTPTATAPAATGLFSPYVVSGAATVLLVISLIGFFLNWVKLVIDMSVEEFGMKVEGRMNGFGILKLTEDFSNSSESEIDSQHLILAVLSLVLLIVGALCVVALRKIPVVGPVLLILSGLLQLASAVLGLMGDEKSAVLGADSELSDYERQIFEETVDNIDISKGPGQYLVLLTGVLLIVLGALYLLRTVRHPTSNPNVPAGFPDQLAHSGFGTPASYPGFPGQPVQPGRGAVPGQYGNPAQPGQQGGYGAPGQPSQSGFLGQQRQNGYPDSPNGSANPANPENPYGTPRP